MKVFAHHRVEEIPVLDSEKPRQIIGTLHYQDVLNAYNQLLNRLNLAEGLASEFKTLQEDALQEVIPGFSLAEVDVPEEFAGKSIGELQLRNKYRIDVLMIEEGAQSVFAGRGEKKKQVMPDKDYVLHRDDRLIIYGRTLDVINFKKIAEQG
jgi:Trk K+ transport system NAD-binding subunit